MSQPIIPRDEAAERLAVPVRVLIRYEARGLVRVARDGSVEGYEPAEIRRLGSIVSYQRDLGINLAGVEAVLKLRDHLAEVHHRLGATVRRLREALEGDEPTPDADA
jgi:MerR family transcriptional regulator, heat shock protein HspR